MEQKLQSIIPDARQSVMQYALEHPEPRKGPSIFPAAQKNSVSVLRTVAINSNPFEQAHVEPLDAYMRDSLLLSR